MKYMGTNKGLIMKRMLLIITLICIVIVSNSYNFPSKRSGQRTPAYNYKTLEVMYDSKQRPHKIVIYSGIYQMAAIDLDANTYSNR